MRKILGLVLCLSLIVGAVPFAADAATTDSWVIDKHGAKTYIGLTADWGKTWNEDNFTEVTNEDVDCSGNLTVKIGDVADITVSGSDSKIIITDGNIGSIQADGNITLNGGTIKHDVESDQTITLSGKVTVGGDCVAEDITATGSTTATVSGSLIGSDTITLGSTGVKADEISGDLSGTLQIKNFTLTLPSIVDMREIDVTGNCTVGEKIIAGNLSLPQKTELVANSTVELDTLTGPGTLAFTSGRLTIHDGVEDRPFIRFNNTVGNGSLAFKADSGVVDEDEIELYDFALEKDTSGGYDSFRLTDSIKEGITLSDSSVSVDSKNPALVKATVRPTLSNFATGTKIVWELHGETTAFTISPDSTKNTCKVSLNSSQTGSHKATLIAYLVDQRGDRLTDYKSDSCVITSGTPQTVNNGSGLTLDTSNVTIPVGGTYWVLAVTNSTVPPVQMSYNSAVATVGAPVTYSANGKSGWLYPVKGVSKGEVTIDIGGQKMITAVAAGSIIVDTSSYTMSPGGKYCIGVKINGLDRKKINVHSANSCTTIQYAGYSGGLDLYVVKGEQAGVGYAIFDIIGGQSVRTQINVQSGATPGGVSARLIAAG